jgi:hypothetical protein
MRKVHILNKESLIINTDILDHSDYTYDQCLNFYNDYCEFNLPRYPYEVVWLHPSEIKLWGTINNWHLLKMFDPILEEMKNNKEKFGIDILENGMYWPFMIRIEDGEYICTDGNHRLEGIKILDEKGKWPKDRKLMCFIQSKTLFDCSYAARWDKSIRNTPAPTLVGNPITMHIPEKVILDINQFNDALPNNTKVIGTSNFQSIGDGIVEVNELYSEVDINHILMAYPLWFRWVMKNLEKKGGRLKGHPLVNDYEYFTKNFYRDTNI